MEDIPPLMELACLACMQVRDWHAHAPSLFPLRSPLSHCSFCVRTRARALPPPPPPLSPSLPHHRANGRRPLLTSPQIQGDRVPRLALGVPLIPSRRESLWRRLPVSMRFHLFFDSSRFLREVDCQAQEALFPHGL
jgi:hypothetical protein